jgi:hypothetical protein
MVQIKQGCPAGSRDSVESSPLARVAAAIAAALLFLLAFAAAHSGGPERLLPNDQPFVPHSTT